MQVISGVFAAQSMNACQELLTFEHLLNHFAEQGVLKTGWNASLNAKTRIWIYFLIARSREISSWLNLRKCR
jgi:hypothetical protein